MISKVLWALFALLAILIGLYPIAYFVIDRTFGLLGQKPEALLDNVAWNTAFYTHIILGGFALFIGWSQFSKTLRNKYLHIHRVVGKAYVFSAILSGLAALYIGFYATGGMISIVGFVSLGLIWLYTTFMAYTAIKAKDIVKHQHMMIFSYAACFAAVMLRIWLPILSLNFDFVTAYRIVAWLCWVPNLVVAYLIVRRMDLAINRNQ